MNYKSKDQDADLFIYLKHIAHVTSEQTYWKNIHDSIFNNQYHCYCCRKPITKNDGIPYNQCDSCHCKYHTNCYKTSLRHTNCPKCKKEGTIYTMYN